MRRKGLRNDSAQEMGLIDDFNRPEISTCNNWIGRKSDLKTERT